MSLARISGNSIPFFHNYLLDLTYTVHMLLILVVQLLFVLVTAMKPQETSDIVKKNFACKIPLTMLNTTSHDQ